MTTEALSREPDALDVRRHVTAMYTEVAEGARDDLHFPVGRAAAAFVGYPAGDLDLLPPGAIESFAGVGYPFLADAIRRGDTVLDVGSGSGTDLLLAARRVGPEGRALGLDCTPAMIRKARANAEAAGATNVVVVEGDAGERIPLPDASVDVVTSNGVLNLVPDKPRAFAEIARVLAPGGRLQLADVVVHAPIPPAARCDGELWAACIAGADVEASYLATIRAAGLVDVRVLHRLDYFAAAPREDARRTAARYRAEALVVTGRKPA